MREDERVVIAGLGDVGKCLFEIISKYLNPIGVDVDTCKQESKIIEVLHICYPFQIADFVGESVRYIELFHPKLTIVNSTVPVGTTRAIVGRTGAAVAHSPVRGKHVRMLDDLVRYVKFVGAIDRVTAEQAARHFDSIGMKTKILSSPEAAELAKLTETTYFGLLIAWAQDVERACDQLGTSYDEVVSFYEEIGFFPPVKYFPGIIGGHCVMPNIELLRLSGNSQILDAIRSSNQKKIERQANRGLKRTAA